MDSKVGFFNMCIGVLTIVSGLTGRYGLPGPRFVLPFTESPNGLYIAGALIVAHGAHQAYKNRPR